MREAKSQAFLIANGLRQPQGGCMQIDPRIVTREEQHFLGIAEATKIPFQKTIDRVVPELFSWLERKGIEPAGPLFFKYDRIAMPELDIVFGIPTVRRLEGDGRVVSGTLPAGRYAEVTYFGHYKNLMQVTGALIDWAREQGIAWDSIDTPEGERFACRLEIYPTNPAEEPDPEKWETILRFKIRD
jgi:effector-binding domain-containing protein